MTIFVKKWYNVYRERFNKSMGIKLDDNGMVYMESEIEEDAMGSDSTVISALPVLSPADFIDCLCDGHSLIVACKMCKMSMQDLQSILADTERSSQLQSILSSKYVGIDMVALDNLAHDVLSGDPRAIGLWLKTRIPKQSNVTVRLVRE